MFLHLYAVQLRVEEFYEKSSHMPFDSAQGSLSDNDWVGTRPEKIWVHLTVIQKVYTKD